MRTLTSGGGHTCRIVPLRRATTRGNPVCRGGSTERVPSSARMTGLDWVLVGALVVAAVGGTTQGFLSASLSFVGFVGGALAGARLGPLVLPNGTDDVNAPVAALFGAVLLGTLVGGVLQQVGYRIRRRLRGS